jgi:hypothetical protein
MCALKVWHAEWYSVRLVTHAFLFCAQCPLVTHTFLFAAQHPPRHSPLFFCAQRSPRNSHLSFAAQDVFVHAYLLSCVWHINRNIAEKFSGKVTTDALNHILRTVKRLEFKVYVQVSPAFCC